MRSSFEELGVLASADDDESDPRRFSASIHDPTDSSHLSQFWFAYYLILTF